MGGDGQPQFQAQIFTRIARFGMEPGEAVAAPRWLLGKTWGRDIAGLAIEGRFDTDLATALGRAGHEISMLDEDYADSMGHAGAILRLPNGRLLGASDPRSDGAAIAG
jgi:gamma-glutamyltranspeptidase/glutathione hydrolase